MLAVSDPAAAIDFYTAAFGARSAGAGGVTDPFGHSWLIGRFLD